MYKFHRSIINLLKQNNFISLADRLQIVQQISFDSNNTNLTNDFIQNAECLLKDIIKVLQTCMTTLMTTIYEYQNKEKEDRKEPESSTEAASNVNHQSLILQEKESIINDLTIKHENITKILDDMNKTHEEKLMCMISFHLTLIKQFLFALVKLKY